MPSPTPVGLLISRDLFFTSKVSGTAAMLGLQVKVVADVASAVAACRAGPVRYVFCDLADPALDVAALVASFSADNRPRVVAFGSHVATARLAAARAAGCDDVLPRSRFSAELPDLLRRYSNSSARSCP